jgi:hypothetical protein
MLLRRLIPYPAFSMRRSGVITRSHGETLGSPQWLKKQIPSGNDRKKSKGLPRKAEAFSVIFQGYR